MAEPIPVIPTLFNQSAQILSKIEDIAAYTVQWFFANPGETSIAYEKEMASFRKFNSMYGTRPEELCSKVAETLGNILRKYKPTIRVDCEYEMEPKVDDTGHLLGTYGFIININDAEGNPVIPYSHVKIGENHKTLEIKFSNTRLGADSNG